MAFGSHWAVNCAVEPRMLLRSWLVATLNYIQETGRCSRDGGRGKCVALVNRKDYQAMRWLESGGRGGGTQASVVRRLLVALLGDSTTYKRHPLSEDAVAALGKSEEAPETPSSQSEWQSYSLGLHETEAAKEMNCSTTELHSVLAHLCRYGSSHLTLMSSFPTKLKLRFFRTDPAELMEVDPLLRKVLPLAKKTGPVYTIETVKAVATLGGTAAQLSTSLWQAGGDEFSVEKADYGYMLTVRKPVTEAQIDDWAEQISQINVRARESAIEKLDASYIALTRAAEASERQKVADPDAELPAAHTTLHTLIDAYFAALEDPTLVMAGSAEERRRLLTYALGADFRTSVATPLQARPVLNHQDSGKPQKREAPEAQRLQGITVTVAVVRLLGDPAWPSLPCEELDAIVRAVAQFLAGVSSVVMPAAKWRDHRMWGHLRGAGSGDFDRLEELVREGVLKNQMNTRVQKMDVRDMLYDILDRVKVDTLVRTLRSMIEDVHQELFCVTLEEVLSDFRGLKVGDMLKQSADDAEKISRLGGDLLKVKQEMAQHIRDEKQAQECLQQLTAQAGPELPGLFHSPLYPIAVINAMLQRLLLPALLLTSSHADTSATVLEVSLGADRLSGMGLGPQLTATRQAHATGVTSVELTGTQEGFSRGLGLQMRAVESPALGLGPQLDARITPGRPIPSLRGQVQELTPLPWDLLRAAICLVGLAMVYLAVAHREAEQGRLSGIKSFFGALAKNRNALMQTTRMWQESESLNKDLEQSLEESQVEAADWREKAEQLIKEPAFLREKMAKMREEQQQELEALRTKLKEAQKAAEKSNKTEDVDLATSLSMSGKQGSKQFADMADMVASTQQGFNIQEQFTIALSLLKGCPSSQVTKTADIMKALVEDTRPNLMKELLASDHGSLGPPKVRLGAAQKLLSGLPQEDQALVADLLPPKVVKEITVKVLEDAASDDAADMKGHAGGYFDPNIDISKRCKKFVMTRLIKKLNSQEVKVLFDELGQRTKKAILIDIFDYQDPKDLELCAEMIFVERIEERRSAPSALPELLRQQHEEVIRRLDFQDEVLRGLTLNRRTSMGSKMSRPKTEGDESQSVPVSPVKPIQTDISPPRNGFSGEKVRTATGRAQMRRTFSVAGSPTHAKKGFEPRYGGHSCIWHMVHHPVFESFFAVVVVTNAVFIGIDVQRSVDHGDPRPTEFRVIQYLYAAIFTVELLLRLAADGLHFFCSEDWAWSWLDLFIVLSSLWEVVVDITGSSDLDAIAGVSGLKSFRIVRLSRILRTAQFVSIFRFVIALRMLVTSILHTLKALVWAMTLLVLIVYVFAVLFTQAVSDYKADSNTTLVHQDAAQLYFGSLVDSMLTLFMSLAGGVSWEQALAPLREISAIWVICYVGYIAFTYFAVLNVVTAVFCQSAIESAQNDQVTLMQNMLMNKEKHVRKIQELFGRLGATDDGHITLQMFEENINSDSVTTYFEALGLDVWDAWAFFKLLDSDGGGSVDVEEFFMGCLRFRGQAKAMDVGQLIQDQSWMIKNQGKFQSFMEAEMSGLKHNLASLMHLCSRPEPSVKAFVKGLCDEANELFLLQTAHRIGQAQALALVAPDKVQKEAPRAIQRHHETVQTEFSCVSEELILEISRKAREEDLMQQAFDPTGSWMVTQWGAAADAPPAEQEKPGQTERDATEAVRQAEQELEALEAAKRAEQEAAAAIAMALAEKQEALEQAQASAAAADAAREEVQKREEEMRLFKEQMEQELQEAAARARAEAQAQSGSEGQDEELLAQRIARAQEQAAAAAEAAMKEKEAALLAAQQKAEQEAATASAREQAAADAAAGIMAKEMSKDWSCGDVREWLASSGYPEVALAAFHQNVEGKMLPHLGHEGWKELGFTSAVQRARILSAVADFGTDSRESEQPFAAAPVRAANARGKGTFIQRFGKAVKLMDGFIWSDHKPVWFQHLEQSGKSPEELRELFCIQLDSYNLMTLLLLSSVVPTATGICADIGWDEDGWPVDKLKFFCLIFSFIYSGLLILHFCMSHILHLLVSGVSPANYPVFMRACGCDFLSEIGVAYVVILYLFAPWMFSCMAVLLGRSANWIIWASSFGVVILSWIFQASLTFPLLGRHDDGSRPRVADTAYNSSRLLLRLVLHSGLLHQDRAPLDPSLPRDALLEQMAEISLEEIEHRARASEDRLCLQLCISFSSAEAQAARERAEQQASVQLKASTVANEEAARTMAQAQAVAAAAQKEREAVEKAKAAWEARMADEAEALKAAEKARDDALAAAACAEVAFEAAAGAVVDVASSQMTEEERQALQERTAKEREAKEQAEAAVKKAAEALQAAKQRAEEAENQSREAAISAQFKALGKLSRVQAAYATLEERLKIQEEATAQASKREEEAVKREEKLATLVAAKALAKEVNRRNRAAQTLLAIEQETGSEKWRLALDVLGDGPDQLRSDVRLEIARLATQWLAQFRLQEGEESLQESVGNHTLSAMKDFVDGSLQITAALMEDTHAAAEHGSAVRSSSEKPSPHPKRPRVSFTTVSMRTFSDGDVQELSSPKERALSPILDGCAGTEEGDLSGEVTANVESLSRLVLEDELDDARNTHADAEMKPPLESLPEQPVLKVGQDTPVRTPTTEQETSPLPESWDLYKQFKGRLFVQIGILSSCMFQVSLGPTSTT
eukprot:s1123_g12.t1